MRKCGPRRRASIDRRPQAICDTTRWAQSECVETFFFPLNLNSVKFLKPDKSSFVVQRMYCGRPLAQSGLLAVSMITNLLLLCSKVRFFHGCFFTILKGSALRCTQDSWKYGVFMQFTTFIECLWAGTHNQKANAVISLHCNSKNFLPKNRKKWCTISYVTTLLRKQGKIVWSLSVPIC